MYPTVISTGGKISDLSYFEEGVVKKTIQKIVPVFVSISQNCTTVKPFLQKNPFFLAQKDAFSRKKF
ncbi:MAG: hypothetical protein Q4D37_01585 [Oscillospiraceae bacterium]|nr:hypothetical protein [Oscillospiraceae bacterium]